MLQDEVRVLLDDLKLKHDGGDESGRFLEPDEIDEFVRDAPRLIGFHVDHAHQRVVPVRVDYAAQAVEDYPSDSKEMVFRHSFLNLGVAAGLRMPAARPGKPNRYRIGLNLAHPFPPSVEGTLTGTVLNHCNLKRYHMSANHVIWMNGWAVRNSRVVLDPFDAGPLCEVGRVPARAELRALKGGDEVSTTQEISFATVTREVFFLCEKLKGKDPIRQPVAVDPSKELFRADNKGKGKVLSSDFRFGIRMEFGRFLFKKQLLLMSKDAFAERGDSGALLFQALAGGGGKMEQQTDLQAFPVAMLWAGMPDEPEHPHLFVATPLHELFQRERLEFTGYLTPKQYERNVARAEQRESQGKATAREGEECSEEL